MENRMIWKKNTLLHLYSGLLGRFSSPDWLHFQKFYLEAIRLKLPASNLSYTFFGVLVLGLLTGAIRKQERILTTFISLIIFGLPLLILWQQKVVFNLNVLVWGLLVLVGIVLVVVWVRQMIQDDKNQ